MHDNLCSDGAVFSVANAAGQRPAGSQHVDDKHEMMHVWTFANPDGPFVHSIGPSERWERDGMVVTSATRSILEAAEKGADPEQIQLAVVQAIERGLATVEELRRAAGDRSRRVEQLITGARRKAAA